MKIDHLAAHLHHLPLLARWFHDEWGYLSPDCTLAERMDRLRAKANREGIPMTFIALDGETPIGSASLVACDMDTRAHLTPWLSSVYVDVAARRSGVGEALVARVVREARNQGCSTLYLWTPSAEAFYRKRGWRTLERTTYRNAPAVVMQHRPAAAPAD